MDEIKPETNKSKVIVAIRWIVGVLFLFAGISALSKFYIVVGLLYLLCGLISLPLIDSVLENKFNFHMSGILRFVVVFLLFFGTGLVLPHDELKTNNNQAQVSADTSVKMNSFKSPDGKPVTEFYVSTPYSTDKDSWMKTYTQQHHTNSNPELFLFTFADGKQFEYDYTGVGQYNTGMLLPGNWTEEPNESLKPTKITDQQFQQNMNSILSKWSGSSYEFKSDSIYGEVLDVYINEKLAVTGYDVQASILKNYVDLKPDRTAYHIILITPSAVEGTSIYNGLVYSPKDHQLIEFDSMTGQTTKQSLVWTDATYTSIVNAIEANDFTNNPAKVGYS